MTKNLTSLALLALLAGCSQGVGNRTYMTDTDTNVVGDPGEDDDGDGLSEDEGDCDDGDDSAFAGATEVPCTGVDEDCDGLEDDSVDGDDDGFGLCAEDCDDANGAINPEATDLLGDEVDQNCDGLDGTDGDGDGFVSIETGGDDCEDDREVAHPGAEELCGGTDEDCDGILDNKDSDGDGHIDEACATTYDGTAAVRTDDCDDANELIFGGNAELVEGQEEVDNNCDGSRSVSVSIDWFATANPSDTAMRVSVEGAAGTSIQVYRDPNTDPMPDEYVDYTVTRYETEGSLDLRESNFADMGFVVPVDTESVTYVLTVGAGFGDYPPGVRFAWGLAPETYCESPQCVIGVDPTTLYR